MFCKVGVVRNCSNSQGYTVSECLFDIAAGFHSATLSKSDSETGVFLS